MTESTQGTTIPPAPSIFDSKGARWTVFGGAIFRNSIATISSSVTLLLYWNRIIFQKNSVGNWYRWDDAVTTGNPWRAAFGDPRATPAPTPKPTSMPIPDRVTPTTVEFYQGGVLVGQAKLVKDGS